MGYYSDVIICLYKKDFSELCQNISKIKDSGLRRDVTSLMHHGSISIIGEQSFEGDAVVMMHWDGIKWYKISSREIKYLMDYLQDDDRQYSFKRIGEDYYDYEEKSNDENCTLSNYALLERHFDCTEGTLLKSECLFEMINPNEPDVSDYAEMSFDDVLSGGETIGR